MRHWLFHPLIFYPLIAIAAAGVITLSLRPQSWPRAPAPITATVDGAALVISGDGFNSPAVGAEQEMTVKRDFWGHAQSMLIAQKPGQPPPTPAEQGARILLTAEQAALIEDQPVTVEVDYLPLPINAATGLAASLQGIGPAEWVSQEAPPLGGTVRFELPPQFAVDAIGLRALSGGADQAYGLEITRVRITPSTGEAAPSPAEPLPAAAPGEGPAN